MVILPSVLEVLFDLIFHLIRQVLISVLLCNDPEKLVEGVSLVKLSVVVFEL